MKRIRGLLLLLLTLTSAMLSAQVAGQGQICGTVRVEDSQELALGIFVLVYKEGVYVTLSSTDLSGQYCLDLSPGEYELRFLNLSTAATVVKGVVVEADQTTTLDVEVKERNPNYSEDVFSICYYIPLLEIDNPGVTPIHRTDIELQPVKEVQDLMINFPGVSMGH